HGSSCKADRATDRNKPSLSILFVHSSSTQSTQSVAHMLQPEKGQQASQPTTAKQPSTNTLRMQKLTKMHATSKFSCPPATSVLPVQPLHSVGATHQDVSCPLKMTEARETPGRLMIRVSYPVMPPVS
ncbi:unnamed protein product, partial [Ectocarpus sp. 12 AP-2014]